MVVKKKATTKTTAEPARTLVDELVNRTKAGTIAWCKSNVGYTWMAEIKDGCTLRLSATVLRIVSPNGGQSILARGENIRDLKEVVRLHLQVRGQPEWVKKVLGIK